MLCDWKPNRPQRPGRPLPSYAYTELSKSDPKDLWITLNQITSACLDQAKAEGIIHRLWVLLYVISSTMTSTDHMSLSYECTVAYMYRSCLWNTALLVWLYAVCLPVAERNLIKAHVDGNFIQQECLLQSQWNLSEADQNLKWRWGENWVYLFELALSDFHVNSYFISFWMFFNTSTTLYYFQHFEAKTKIMFSFWKLCHGHYSDKMLYLTLCKWKPDSWDIILYYKMLFSYDLLYFCFILFYVMSFYFMMKMPRLQGG